MAGSKKKARCECFDKHDGHPLVTGVWPGVSLGDSGRCTNVERLQRLYRIDMADESGTGMCGHCARDAYESGLYVNARGR